MTSSPPRSCSKQSGWPSLCPRSPAYARPHARASPPPPPAVGASFSGARFSFSSRFHHPRSTLCHPVRARPHRSAPPPSGAKHSRKRHALCGPRALLHALQVGTPWRTVPNHPHCPPQRPNSPSTAARPLIGADARHPAGPLTTTTYRTPEPGQLTLSFASDALLAALPEASHHLPHGPPRRHSTRK
jgi:hypothetical protein